MTFGAGLRAADATRYPVGGSRPRRVDWVVAVVATVLQVLAPRTGQASAGERPSWVGALALVLALGQGLPLAWRRVYGFRVAGVVLACYGGYVLAGRSGGSVRRVAGHLVARHGGGRPSPGDVRRIAAAGVTCAFILAGELARSRPEAWGLLSLVTVIVALVSVLVRSEQGRHDAARERAVAEERLRIAGDLHDLVGHGLSVVAVQSSTARMALDVGDEQTARAALTAVESTSRAAMREMRQLLGVLREVSSDDDGGRVAGVEVPLPGLTDIAALVDNVRAGGVAVTAQLLPEAGPVPAAVQLCGYRVVQEALTNAVKHAPGAVVTVRVSSAAGRLRVVVDSAGGMRAPRPAEGGGLGLAGIRARVAAAGGESQIGATADGWRVDVELPLRAQDVT